MILAVPELTATALLKVARILDVGGGRRQYRPRHFSSNGSLGMTLKTNCIEQGPGKPLLNDAVLKQTEVPCLFQRQNNIKDRKMFPLLPFNKHMA